MAAAVEQMNVGMVAAEEEGMDHLGPLPLSTLEVRRAQPPPERARPPGAERPRSARRLFR